MHLRGCLGVDIGSVSTKAAIIDEGNKVIDSVYLATEGYPITALQRCIRTLRKRIGDEDIEIVAVGTTGSGRKLAGILVGADVVKNEITCQTLGCLNWRADIRSIIEIGGQDSKCIILENGVPVWYNMNSLCSAGTGSFLSHQAVRMGIPIEEFGGMALQSTVDVSIAGKCGVFAESDLIHKQQLGFKREDLIKGLCEALASNFLNNVAKNRELKEPILFSGGVSENKGVVKAFEKELDAEVLVPEHNKIVGCVGAAIAAREERCNLNLNGTRFKGFEIAEFDYQSEGFQCRDCANSCEVVIILKEAEVISAWGSKCGKWEALVGKEISEEIRETKDWHPLI